MDDAHVGLGGDTHVKVQQVIVVFVHRAGQRILDWYHRAVDFMASQGAKNVLESREGNNFDFISQELNHGLLTECSQSALKSNSLFFHARTVFRGPFFGALLPPSQRRTLGTGRFSKSSTRSTL